MMDRNQDPRRAISFTKSRLLRKVDLLEQDLSRIFRRTKLGDEVSIGEMYNVAQRMATLGRELEKVAGEVKGLEMKDEVFNEISFRAFRLGVFSTEMRKEAERYFGVPAQRMPLYDPKIQQQAAVAGAKKKLRDIIGPEEDEEEEKAEESDRRDPYGDHSAHNYGADNEYVAEAEEAERKARPYLP